MFHGYTGTLYVAYMNALPKSLERNVSRKVVSSSKAVNLDKK